MSIIHLDDHRSPAYNGTTCPCGSAWFVLRRPDAGAFDPAGAVCLDNNGHITGYTGCPVCIECGTPLEQEEPTP